jgi:hypothetical protein
MPVEMPDPKDERVPESADEANLLEDEAYHNFVNLSL